MTQRHISWILWIIGTVLVGLSWVNLVNNTVGWLGFGIAVIGTVMGSGNRTPGNRR